jgi:Bax protein
MTVAEKKARFYALVAPAVEKVHGELMLQYENIAKDIQKGRNKKEIQALKKTYKVKTNEKLLIALKPHPPSITLAQAAMESAWGTSRFFVKANNVFGVYSVNKNEARIAASEKRKGKKTIWLRKYSSIESSVRAYYRLMARGAAFKEFRALKIKTDDPHHLVQKLDKYSEIGAAYGKELSQLISYNNLTQYD